MQTERITSSNVSHCIEQGLYIKEKNFYNSFAICLFVCLHAGNRVTVIATVIVIVLLLCLVSLYINFFMVLCVDILVLILYVLGTIILYVNYIFLLHIFKHLFICLLKLIVCNINMLCLFLCNVFVT